MNRLQSATASVALVLSTSVNAAIVDHGHYTTDTASGLDWLDLTETISMTYNEVVAQLGPGGALEGWRYASESEIGGFLDAFGGDSTYYDSGWSPQNNGLFDVVAPLWGDTYCAQEGCTPGDGLSRFIHNAVFSSSQNVMTGKLYDLVAHSLSDTEDFVKTSEVTIGYNQSHQYVASALVRDVSPVPVPAAVWLFGTGLLGLIGVTRRKTAA